MWKVIFLQNKAFWWLTLVTGTSRKLTTRPDCTFCSIVLQLLRPFNFLHTSHVWHFGESPVASHSRDLVARILLNAHILEFFTLSHTQLLHDSHLNRRYLIAKIQVNLTRNIGNTWLNIFNLTTWLLILDYIEILQE